MTVCVGVQVSDCTCVSVQVSDSVYVSVQVSNYVCLCSGWWLYVSLCSGQWLYGCWCSGQCKCLSHSVLWVWTNALWCLMVVCSGDLLQKEEEKNTCYNCGLNTTQLHVTSLGSQCSGCYQYWRYAHVHAHTCTLPRHTCALRHMYTWRRVHVCTQTHTLYVKDGKNLQCNQYLRTAKYLCLLFQKTLKGNLQILILYLCFERTWKECNV